MQFSHIFTYFVIELVIYGIHAVKRIIIYAIYICISICYASCGLLFPHPKSDSVIENHAYINFANDTERTIIIEHNLGETEVCEEVASHKKIDIVHDYVYLTKRYDGTIQGDEKGETGYEIGKDFGREYIGNYGSDSYVRIYDADHYLIKEWKIYGCDSSIKNPFDYQYYKYGDTRSGAAETTRWEQATELNYYTWTFHIDEAFLSAE